MSYIKPMKVFNGIKDLVENTSSSSLFEPNFSSHHSKKLSLLSELSNDINMLCSFNDLIEIDNIWMSYFFHNFYFSLNTYLIIFIFYWFFIDDLDGNLFACG